MGSLLPKHNEINMGMVDLTAPQPNLARLSAGPYESQILRGDYAATMFPKRQFD